MHAGIIHKSLKKTSATITNVSFALFLCGLTTVTDSKVFHNVLRQTFK